MLNDQKIFLVINTGYLGDVLLTSKLTRDIKKEYPNSKLIFIVDTSNELAAKGLPGIDEVFCYNRKRGHNIFKFFKYVKNFPYRGKIDFTFIPIIGKANRFILAWFLGSKKVFTLASYQKMSHQKYFCEQNKLHNRYTCQNANMLALLSKKPTDFQDAEYIVAKDAEQKISSCLAQLDAKQDLIAINPMAGDDWKCWDTQEVVKFAKIAMQHNQKIVLTGVLKDGKQCIEALDKEIGAQNYLNFVDKTSIAELGALYKKCQAVISVDTGSMHMACAVETPTVALFFRDNYEYWGPLNLDKNSFIYNPSGIKAEEVYKEIERITTKNKITEAA